MNDIPTFTIVKRGCDQFPRCIIAKGDAYQNPVYWDGSGWTDNEAEARVFASMNAASWVYHDLLLENLEGRPVHRFTTPLYIETYGEKPDLKQLREWLERAVRIVVNSPEHGHGPQDNVAILVLDAEATNDANG